MRLPAYSWVWASEQHSEWTMLMGFEIRQATEIRAPAFRPRCTL
jgi:hypothetical protein